MTDDAFLNNLYIRNAFRFMLLVFLDDYDVVLVVIDNRRDEGVLFILTHLQSKSEIKN